MLVFSVETSAASCDSGDLTIRASFWCCSSSSFRILRAFSDCEHSVYKGRFRAGASTSISFVLLAARAKSVAAF